MPDPMRRTYWSEGWSSQKNHYGDVVGFTLHASAEACADCIGSRTADGCHAPLLDLDFPASLRPDEGAPGRTRLFIERDVPDERLRSVWERLFDAGFGPPPTEIVPAEHASLAFIVPIRLLPSRSPGHFHLYIDATISWKQQVELLEDLAWAGIIEARFRDMCLRQRMSFLRVPGRG